MPEATYPRGAVPPGRYARGGRSPVVHVWLCAPCAGYAPLTAEGGTYQAGQCDGCRATSRELHRFQALIMSAANGGCVCDSHHRQVTGDLPTEQSAMQVLTEVQTRPAQYRSEEERADDVRLPGAGHRQQDVGGRWRHRGRARRPLPVRCGPRVGGVPARC